MTAAPRFSDYEHLLLPSLQHTESGTTIEDVRRAIEEKRALFWPGRESVAVTNACHEFNLWLVGGKIDELFEMEAAAAGFARSRGFNRMCAEGGRPGWRRALKRIGYYEVTQMVKDL